MRRMRQVFCVPEGLSGEPPATSPWDYGDQARLPMEHWEAIVAFARERDEREAEFLERIAVLDGKILSDSTQDQALELLEKLAQALPRSPSLTPDDIDPDTVPEPMPNTEHARMLRDVMRIIRLGQSAGVCFDSWVD